MSVQSNQEPKGRRQSFSASDHRGQEVKGTVLASHYSGLLLIQEDGEETVWLVDNLEDTGVSLDVEQAEWLFQRVSAWLAERRRAAASAAQEQSQI